MAWELEVRVRVLFFETEGTGDKIVMTKMDDNCCSVRHIVRLEWLRVLPLDARMSQYDTELIATEGSLDPRIHNYPDRM